MDAIVVADIRNGATDRFGTVIEEVYQRKDGEYAVYRTQKRVLVHFSDNTDQAALQRRAIAPLLPLRDDIDGLTQGWRDADQSNPSSHGFFGLRNPDELNAKAKCQDRRVGGALAQAFEDDVPGAQLLLEKIKSDILNERIAAARFEYLLIALTSSLGVMLLAWLLASILPRSGPAVASLDPARMRDAGTILILLAIIAGIGFGTASRSTPRLRAGLAFAALVVVIFALLVWPASSVAVIHPDFSVGLDMWRGAAAGAVGAFFSIALAIRGRTVLPELLRTANLLDAVLRVTVGAIGGAVLVALVRGGVADFSLVAKGSALFAPIAGFFAGFAERLVPDLLERAGEKPADLTSQRAAARAEGQVRLEQKLKAAHDPAAAAVAAVNDNVADGDVEVGPRGFELEDDEVTFDEDLPAASGGVARA